MLTHFLVTLLSFTGLGLQYYIVLWLDDDPIISIQYTPATDGQTDTCYG